MNKNLLLLFLLTTLTLSPLYAQVEMADNMRAEGKIYVVVGIILIILAGFILYLFLIDRKVRKLEKMLNEKQQQTK